MQTFLPYSDFARTACVLDRQRLGKQRVETLQILNTLCSQNKGWANHPAVKMWKGHEGALIYYGVAICDEWISRGYKDTCRDKILAFRDHFLHNNSPQWIGREDFHASHRANLLRKNWEYYTQFGWNESVDMEYVWPV